MKGQSTICLQVETLIFLITVFFSFIAWRLLRRWRIKFRLQARAEPNRCGRGSCCWSTDPMRPGGAPRGKGNVAAASVNTRMRETELSSHFYRHSEKKTTQIWNMSSEKSHGIPPWPSFAYTTRSGGQSEITVFSAKISTLNPDFAATYYFIWTIPALTSFWIFCITPGFLRCAWAARGFSCKSAKTCRTSST